VLAGTFIVSEREIGAYAFALFGLPILMLWMGEKQYLDRSRSTVRGSNDDLEAANQRPQGPVYTSGQTECPLARGRVPGRQGARSDPVACRRRGGRTARGADGRPGRRNRLLTD